MFKYTATYKDIFNPSETVKEDLYFHMITPEFAELEINTEGGFGESVRRLMVMENNGREIYNFFVTMVKGSYGRRTEDGKKFLKKPEWVEEFLVSPEWEDFFLWLTDPAAEGANASAFWMGIFPDRLKSMMDEVQTTTEKDITQFSKEELLELLKKKTPANGVEAN